MKAPSNGISENSAEGERKSINSELWHACAGPLVYLPPVGSLVLYFPQGHSEQVAASMQKEADFVPSYPNLPSKLICMLHNVTLHADPETDEVYAQMTLQPVSKYDNEALLASDLGLKLNRQPAEFFCKTLTNSDTSTHGGFSVPRRAAEKIFPPLDYSHQPPAQELTARDLHDNSWTFRHIYRGQPKRHLLTTGWSIFVGTKRLFAGDSVLFIRDEKSQLLLGTRRANRQQPTLSSSVISNESMHIGILAAAAHAASNNSPFTVFFNPRASPSEFVVPLAKYNKAMYTQGSLGMRFRMMFETEESGVRRYMGTITGISDLDPVRWKNSQWRNLQVGWDESTAGERPSRVSIWEIEPVVTPFYICPPPFYRPRFPKQPGMPDDESDMENAFKRAMPWLGEDFGMKDAPNAMFPGLSLVQWMSMQQNNQFPAAQSAVFPSIQTNPSTDDPSKLLNFQSSALPPTNLYLNKANLQNQVSQLQQQQLQQLTQSPIQLQQKQQQQTPPQQQQQQQPVFHVASANTNVGPPSQVANPNMQQPIPYSQLHQQLLTSNKQSPPSVHPNKNLYHLTALPHDSQFTPQIEQQSNLSQRHQQSPIQFLEQGLPQRVQQTQVQQSSQKGLSEQQHLQLHLLQKLQQQQQQQQQLLSPPQMRQLQNQQQAPIGNNLATSGLMQTQPYPLNQNQTVQIPAAVVRANSGLTEGDAPSCSTSPSTNNCQILPSGFVNRNQQVPSIVLRNSSSVSGNLAHELQSKSDSRIKLDQRKFKSSMGDQLEASTSGTSYCLDNGTIQQNFSLPSFGIDGDIQLHNRNNTSFGLNIDGLAPDTFLSRGYDSQKDLQNLLSNYTPRDIETELSTAAISSQSFGVPNIPFKPSCSGDVAINETGGLGNGLWSNQTQRMRTYTKVQKRGSVGRSIDVTRYIGYDELRHDLARMFGIEGQLEDPHSSDWKLVYVDHENDILLVGDDPWEEFVSCVQSIKILSAVEVEQMSLDGDLGNVPAVPNQQGCSGTDSGNVWRGQFDDSSAASFNR